LEKKATAEQIADIKDILTSDDVRYERAQEFIDAHRPQLIAMRLRRAESEGARLPLIRLSYWEQLFPGRGTEIMALLEPFYKWEPKLLPWNSALVLGELYMGTEGYHGSAVFPLKDEERLWAKKARVIDFADGERHAYRFDLLLDGCGSEQTAAALKGLANVPFMQMLKGRILDTLLDQLTIACGNVYRANIKASEYMPLFRLWLYGNYPLGLDSDRCLLLLVAD